MHLQPSTIVLISTTVIAVVALIVWGNFYRNEEELLFGKKWYPLKLKFTKIHTSEEYMQVCEEISRLRKVGYITGNQELIDKYVAACIDYCNRTGI